MAPELGIKSVFLAHPFFDDYYDAAGIYSTVEFVVDELCEHDVGDYRGTNESTWNRD